MGRSGGVLLRWELWGTADIASNWKREGKEEEEEEEEEKKKKKEKEEKEEKGQEAPYNWLTPDRPPLAAFTGKFWRSSAFFDVTGRFRTKN